MAYLIMRIEPAENDTINERSPDRKPIVATIVTRCALDWEAKGGHRQIPAILAKHGFETMEDWPVARAPRTDWPFTAYTYVSPNRAGLGRVASQLKRIPVRRVATLAGLEG